jgi:UDP-glucose 4-epimerase
MCRTRGIKKFIFASSRECYGNANHEKYTEDLVRVEHCESPYTASKLGGEALVWSYKRCYDIEPIIFRFSNVYGMYDESNRIVPLFVRLARANAPMTVFGEGKCLDFTYIDDTVAGIMLGIKKFDTAKNDSYNLAFGEGTTLVHLAQEVTKLIGASSTLTLGPSRRGEVVRYVADISKAKKVLGYMPTTPFAEGIRKSVEWYKQNT